jgi:gliding motility-associated-like protein
MSENQTITINSCSGTIYDAGGVGGNYTNSEVSTVILNSGDPALGASVTFTSFNLQANFDFLYIYAGSGNTGALLATLTGNGIPSPATYTSTNSTLTLYFVSSNSVTRPGFEATISCDTIPLCNDGIQNGAETGIDCGGCTSCPPCFSVPQVADATSSASADDYLLPCVGGTVNLTAVGQNSIPLLSTTFNDSTPGLGWNFVGSGMFDNPCGPSPNGTPHIWFGNTSPHPRNLTTNEMNLPCGGRICFDLKFSEQGGAGSCEGPDLDNEGVALMYSVDCGATFAPIAYFKSDGTIQPYNTMTPGNSVFGPTAFTDWNNYCFDLPPAAFSDHTIIRWHQEETSGAGFDHWGLDEINITATNCTPYYFDWAHIPGFPDSANVSATITQTTTFDVIYTNGINDTIASQITVVVDTIFNSIITTVKESCMTYTDGTATFKGQGSSGPYTFTLDGPNGFHQVYVGDSMVTATNLPAGNFTLTTSTANICSIVDTFSIQEGFPIPNVTIGPLSTHLCFGDGPITITSNVTDGLPGYSYSWSNGDTTTQITVGAGNYSLTVTDQRGCSGPVQTAVVLQDMSPINANAGPDLSFCKMNNGPVNVLGSIQIASGGIWSGGNGNYSPSNTSLNLNYTPTAAERNQGFVDLILSSTGNHNCPPDADTMRITFFTFAETITLTKVNSLCSGANNGSAIVTSVGAFSPSTYSWDNAAASGLNTRNNLAPGNHTVRIINSMGCDTTLNFTITEPVLLTMSMTPLNAHLCFGDPNLIITSSVVGGTAPYIYNWNTGQTTASLSAGVGTHTLTVRDQNGCGPVVRTSIFTQDALPIAVNAGLDVNVCRQSPGIIQLAGTVQTATGGTWTGGVGIFSPSNNTLNVNYTPTVAEVAQGYLDLTLTSTGNNNCPAVSDVKRINFLSFAENITLNPTNVTCFGYNNGQANVVTTGTYSPATYSWDNGPVSATNSISNLAPGIHSVKIINSMGCDTTLIYTITQPLALSLSVTPPLTHLCFGDGPITLSSSVSGGSLPYSYTWNNGQNTPNVLVGAGNYTLTVTDQFNCPSVSQSAIINQDALPILANAGSDVRVCRQNPGIIHLVGTVQTATGGVWSGGNGTYTPSNSSLNLFYTPTITEVSQGYVDLTLTTTGNNNCAANSDVVRISFLSFAENITINTTAITCFGANNGIATVSTTGAYSPATFSWNNGAIVASGIKNNLTPGAHQVRIINSMGCDTTIQFSIIEPTQLTLNISPVSAHLCFGDGPIAITSTVAGGVAPYSYSWNTGASTSSITAGPGTYILTIRDLNNCSPISMTSIITQDALPIMCNAGFDKNVCRQNPGTIALQGVVQTATGGIWSGGNGTYNPSNTSLNLNYTPTPIEVGQGFIDLTFITTGNNNCIGDTDVVRINFLSFAENIILNTTNITCKGFNNGRATVTTSGVYSPSTYSWDNTVPTSNNSQLSLSPGLHQVRIINSMGCDTTLFFAITEPNQLVATLVNTTDNLCFGNQIGTASVTVNGGVAPYSFSWNTNPIQTNDTAVGLAGGNYICSVLDVYNCQTNISVTITEPPVIQLSLNSINPSCTGFSNGALASITSGGTLPYQYLWSNGATSSSIINLVHGNYSLTVQDAQGCIAQSTMSVIDPPQLVANITNDTIICPNSSLQLSVTAIGGTGQYSYIWNPGGMQTQSVIVSPASNQIYSCIVRDANNCSVNLSTYVNIKTFENLDIISSVNSNEVCAEDTVYLSAQYLGSDPTVNINWVFCPTCNTDNPLPQAPTSDTYYVLEGIDNCGIVIRDSVLVTVLPLPNVLISPLYDTICPGQMVSFQSVGDNSKNWAYTWDFGDSTYASGLKPSHIYYESGTYPVFLTIIDGNGCHATNHDQSTVFVYPKANADFLISSYSEDLINPVFTFENQSVDANSYNWIFGDGLTSQDFNPTHEYSKYGVYEIILEANNAFGCIDTAKQFVTVTASYALYAPNAFTLNDDKINEVFMLRGYGIKDRNFSLLIYNRWGEVIHESKSINEPWDGTRDGGDGIKPCQDGVYIWVVFFEDVTGQKHRKEGHVTLLK